MAVDPHHLAEERSLAAHRVIASRLEQEPKLIDDARARVEAWLADGTMARAYAEAWRALLDRELAALTDVLVDPGERGRALRQCTPFAGALEPRARWRLWARVREELEAQ